MTREVWTALVTPFKQDLSLDLEGLESNIRHQIDGGVDGIVVLGTTGEAPTLEKEEKTAIIKCAKKFSIPLMVGCGSYSTQEALKMVQEAEKLGAASALIVTPYYNKPTQEGIFLHFQALSKASPLPLVVYNIPGRCSVNIEPETLGQIAALPSVIGVKEASGNMGQIQKAKLQMKGKLLYSGDDALTLPVLAIGGHGVISVASNLFPGLIKELVMTESLKLHEELLPIFEALFVETNPIPVKWAMNAVGLSAGPLRLPLCSLSKKHHELVTKVVNYGQKKSLIPTA